MHIMHSRIVSLEKLFTLKMDKFLIRSGDSKRPETAKEPEKCKTKCKETKNMITNAHGCSKIAGLAILHGCERTIVQTLYCHVCRMFPQMYLITAYLYATRTVILEEAFWLN